MSPIPFRSRLVIAWLGVFVAGWMVGLQSYSAIDAGRDAFERAARSTIYTWIILGLPLGVLHWTRRRSHREALIHKLSEAVGQSRSGIIIFSQSGHVEFVNEGLAELLGIEAKQLLGRSFLEFRNRIQPATIIDLVWEEISKGRSWEGEWALLRSDGEQCLVTGVVSPVRNRSGTALGFIAVVNDLSAQHRTQEELRAAKERAEAGDQAKGQFLATMSHEVRTPLNGIVGFTRLLLETPLTPEQREYVHTIRTSGEALVHLTSNILDFSKVESGAMQLEPDICDLRETVEDALDIFAARAAERGIELLHWIETDVPRRVIIDRGRLRQVIVNLVGNAIKFTETGEVEVHVRGLTGKGTSLAPFDLGSPTGQLIAELEDGGLTFEFSVRDTGIGISAEDRPRLFKPFTQLDSSTVRRYGGAGLGLAISQNLVRLMGGDIWLESQPGKGSTFYFTVRGRPAPHDAATVEAPAPSIAGVRIAVIAEEESLRSELRRVFGLAGATVVDLTLETLLQQTWDFAVIDCGEALRAELDVYARYPEWKVDRMIGLATVGLSKLDREFLRPHFRILLNKPLHHRTLVELLSRAAAKHLRRETAST
jgi:PAS domain S-box-containing protein